MPDPVIFSRYGQNFDLKIKKGPSKKFLWAVRLWVGRQLEPISGYILKANGKQNSDTIPNMVQKAFKG